MSRMGSKKKFLDVICERPPTRSPGCAFNLGLIGESSRGSVMGAAAESPSPFSESEWGESGRPPQIRFHSDPLHDDEADETQCGDDVQRPGMR